MKNTKSRNTQTDRPIGISIRVRGTRLIRPQIRTLLSYCLDSEEADLGRGLEIVFCGDRVMRRVNREFRGKDRTTDVLSFPDPEAVPLPDDADRPPLGEIVVSIPQCKKQALEQGVDPGVELVRLLVHGALHVLGFDHEIDADRRIMVPREQRCRNWARRHHIGPGLLQASRVTSRVKR